VAAISPLLDSCVPYPARLRDLLLSLAAVGLFRPIWSDMIHEEWINNVLANPPELTRAQLGATRSAMDRAFSRGLGLRLRKASFPRSVCPIPTIGMFWRQPLHARAELIIKGFPDSRLDPA
jgi:hypothetical protein